jgi:hypothetical protein
MALGLRKLKDDVGRMFQNAGAAVNKVLDKPIGPKQVSIKQAVQMTAPTVAQDFGKALRGQDRQGNVRPGPNIVKLPGVQRIANMAANTGETIGSGVVDITRGAYQATIKPNVGMGERLKGLAGGAYGVGKIITANPTNPAGRAFQVANIAANSPLVPEPIKRLAAGVQRGQTGIENLSPDVKKKESKIKIAGNEIAFDPIESIGKMYGFTRNPINAKIFKGTEGINLIPGAKGVAGKAANFLLTNITRGGLEDTLMSIKDLPNNASAKEKAAFLRDNFIMGGASEVIFRGGGEGAQTALKSAMSKLGDAGLSKVFDELRRTVTGKAQSRIKIKAQSPIIAEAEKFLRDEKGRFRMSFLS